MSQDYVDLLGTDTLSASRTTLNNSNGALLTLFAGPTEPSASIVQAAMLWADTQNMVLKQRNSTNTDWLTIGKLYSTNLGMLSLSDVGQVMQTSFDMGGFAIENVGVGGATSAARKTDVDAKAPLAAPLFTGDARVDQDPAGAQSIVRKSWAEAQFVAKSGDTMTGRLGTSDATAPSNTQFMTKAEISAHAAFDVASGHRHDGTDARKVRVADLDGRDITGFPDVTSSAPGERLKGTYTGDGTNDRLISLPWRPSIVWCGTHANQSKRIIAVSLDIQSISLFTRRDDSGTDSWAASTQNRTSQPEIDDLGFFVSHVSGSSELGMNDNGETYGFVAIR